MDIQALASLIASDTCCESPPKSTRAIPEEADSAARHTGDLPSAVAPIAGLDPQIERAFVLTEGR